MSGCGRRGPVSPRSGKHPFYCGIRCRSGKWVSEIREPRKTRRIWLGTFPTPEMAAMAYNVAARALRGCDAALNFPHLAASRPAPASTSSNDIRDAATEPPPPRRCRCCSSSSPITSQPALLPRLLVQRSSSRAGAAPRPCYLDEEALFETPEYMLNMAAGMMVSPPRCGRSDSSDDSPDNSSSDAGDSLWSYRDP